jgi:hypothetical protein
MKVRRPMHDRKELRSKNAYASVVPASLSRGFRPPPDAVEGRTYVTLANALDKLRTRREDLGRSLLRSRVRKRLGANKNGRHRGVRYDGLRTATRAYADAAASGRR